MGMDRKGRVMQLSIRAKDEADVADAMAEVNKAADASAGTTKLGALLREQLNKGE
jgi:small subunit ribosomal protein S1